MAQIWRRPSDRDIEFWLKSSLMSPWTCGIVQPKNRTLHLRGWLRVRSVEAMAVWGASVCPVYLANEENKGEIEWGNRASSI